MTNEIQSVMRELEARDRKEREDGLPSEQRMRALVPEAGRFIHMLIRACRYRRVLEIGTSLGYSTLWLASAAQATGGRVDTIEISAERVAAARANFERAGLAPFVTVRQGDAKGLVKGLEAPYDLVFIDAEKDDYHEFLDLAYPMVRLGGLVVADNVLSHSDQLDSYIDKAQHMPGLLSVTVPVGRGEEVSLRVDERGLPAEVVAALAEREVHARLTKDTTSIPRAAGKFLHIVAVAAGAQSVIEVGSNTGLSGLWLASAMQKTGGRVQTVEADAQKADAAKQSFAKAKVASQISIAKGKALDVLPGLDGPFDLAFVNGAKEEYGAYTGQLWPKMRAGGLILADGADSHKDRLAGYVSQMQSRADALSVTLHIGNGMEMTMKLPESSRQ